MPGGAGGGGGGGTATAPDLGLPIYGGLPVVIFAPTFESAVGASWGVARYVVSTAQAPTYVMVRGIKRATLTFRYLLKGDQIKAFIRFLHRQAGRHEACWVPTWQMDVWPVERFQKGRDQLKVEPIEWSSTYGLTTHQDAYGHHVCLLHQDGTVWCTRVIGATAGNPEVLQTYFRPDRDWEPGEYLASWLVKCRLANDEIEVVWMAPDLAEVSVTYVEALDEVADLGLALNPEACAPLYLQYTFAGPLIDASACLPPNASVSGTTFEGYATGLYKPPTNTMQVAGRGITGIYIGDAAFNWPLGTTFECLPEGPLVLVASGSEISEVFAGDAAFNGPRNFDFEQYQTGAYSGGPVGVTGFTEVFAGDGT
jgi:hypothetical protein